MSALPRSTVRLAAQLAAIDAELSWARARAAMSAGSLSDAMDAIDDAQARAVALHEADIAEQIAVAKAAGHEAFARLRCAAAPSGKA